jgi:class 3 adenylate cyclase/tetratricopeptide (TPR) repeat protein
VAVCAACGAENREGARFCDACGEPLESVQPRREQRKTVTALQCDVTGSTALGERIDPESLRAALARYFELAKSVIGQHGGTVEKFIGDAVMAVFGVPVVHEDDALRAVRSAADIRAAMSGLNEELARDYGVTLTLRIGVNTGEVVTGTAERLATGDAVVVAARLEQGAPPGEILLGAETVRLVRESVQIGPLEHVPAKGKTEPLPAYRLLAVSAEAPQRAHAGPFVGRERERRLLADVWERTWAEEAAYLFSVLGTAGVGKSRLTAEFLSELDNARVVRGRCLSYGTGITYWPVVEILKQLLGDDPAATLAELELDQLAVSSLLGLLDEAEQPASSEIAAWSFRKLLERAAENAPVVVVLDDLQWAEPTLLDLVEHVADLSRDAPILLLCLARPDLLERRPGWGGGKLNAAAVLLEPLPGEECERLIDGLLTGETLAEDVRARILAAADGNPLFVEEMLGLIRDGDGATEVHVPPSIQALLAARLDQLDPAERGVLEKGSVEGKVFHRGAVQALGPDETEVPTRLVALVRKELVRPDRTQLPGDDAYRFRHLLIRDAAYEALPKSARAELHERFADWLEEHGANLVELDEILGYHLEQAHRYRVELGPADERADGLGARACVRLTAAADRAGERGDVPARQGLLERSVALSPVGVTSGRLRLELARSLHGSGELERGADIAEGVHAEAVTAGDQGLELLARITAATQGFWAGAQGATEQLESVAREAIPLFESDADDESLVEAWAAAGIVAHGRCHYAEYLTATTHALEHARRAGSKRHERSLLVNIGLSHVMGPTVVEDALRWFDEQRWLEPVRPGLAARRGQLLSYLGRYDEGRAAIAQAEEHSRELGLDGIIGMAAAECRGTLELLAGDTAEAERQIALGVEIQEQLGQFGVASTYAGSHARALLALGRDDEAEASAQKSEKLGASDDVVTQVLWRQARARVLARRGEQEAAVALAREGVALADATDALVVRGDSLADLAEVLERGGELDRAARALERALAEYEGKGVIPAAESTRARLAALRAPA